MKEQFENKYLEFKNIIDILPVNTKANRKKKLDYILEEEKETDTLLNNIMNELMLRIDEFEKLKVNGDIEILEDELEKCNIVNEWNIYNTPYEKMHLDYYLYQLHRYYKEDLSSVNMCIRNLVASFNNVGITLTKDDFDFNNYSSTYMQGVIDNLSDVELKNIFEDIYWKFPEIIKTIEINFKNIYFRNEKKIIKYYIDRHNEYLKNHNDSEIYDLRVKLFNQIKDLKNIDRYLIFKKFKDKEYTVNEFKEADIQKKVDTYFVGDSYSYSNLLKLYNTLFEYNILVKYNYLLMDMRDRLEKKDTLKNMKDTAIKEIDKEVVKLKKLNAKRDKKSGFFKKKDDDKWLFDYKNILNNVISKYDTLDDICFNNIIFNSLSKDSSVLDVLRLISSNYLYFVDMTKKLDDTQSISTISDKFTEFKNAINNNRFTILNNIALLDDKQMKEIIVDKFNLEKIKLTTNLLEKESIDKTIGEIETIINYNNLVRANINLEDIKLYLEMEKICGRV